MRIADAACASLSRVKIRERRDLHAYRRTSLSAQSNRYSSTLATGVHPACAQPSGRTLLPVQEIHIKLRTTIPLKLNMIKSLPELYLFNLSSSYAKKSSLKRFNSGSDFFLDIQGLSLSINFYTRQLYIRHWYMTSKSTPACMRRKVSCVYCSI